MLKAAGDRATANSFVGGFTKGIYDSSMILRFVALRERDPLNFEKLTKIKFQGRRQNGLGVVSTRVFNLINHWLPNYNIPQELILKICAICKANNFKLSTVYSSSSDSRRVITFYQIQCMFHCSNLFLIFHRVSFPLQVRLIIAALPTQRIPLPQRVK